MSQPQLVKSCSCGNNSWISIMSHRIDSLGFEETLWCKDCGTVKKIVKVNGTPNERTIDYRQPKNTSYIKAIK